MADDQYSALEEAQKRIATTSASEILDLSELLLGEQFVVLLDELRPFSQINLSDNNIGDAGAKALAQATHLSGLTGLNISYNNIGEAGAKALTQATHLSGLTELNISGNDIGEAGAKALAQATHLSGLTELDVSFNNIGETGAKAFAQATHLSGLTELDVSFNKIGEAGAKALAQATHLSGLTELDASFNNIGETGAKAFAQATHLSGLTELDASSNDIGDAGAKALAQATHLSGLTLLDISGNKIGDAGAKALAQAIHLSGLTELHISNNDIGGAGAKALAQATHLGGLTELDVENNKIGEAGAKALAQATHLSGLTELDASSNDIGDAGAKALAQATHLSGLTLLGISGNKIGGAGAKALAQAIHLSGLTKLYISHNDIGEAGAKALAQATHLSGLTELDLGDNKIGDAGAKALTQATHLSGLTKLYISHNDIGEAGAKALAQATHLSGLTELDISHNYIGDAGAKALALSSNFPRLQTILLERNDIKNYETGLDNSYLRLQRHFRRLESEGEVLAYELRVFLIGHPKTGKSTLRLAIFDDQYCAPDSTLERTLGVDVSQNWRIPFKNPQTNTDHLLAHIWDFGGQEIQYMCHQYFLNREVFYVLMMNDKTTVDQIYYWLELLTSLAPQARVLPVLNNYQRDSRVDFSWEQGAHWTPYSGEEKLDILKPAEYVDLKEVNTIAALKERITDQLQKTHFRKINKGYAQGREALVKWCEEKHKSYLTEEEFNNYCADQLEWKTKEPHYIEDFLHYLDFVGAVIYFPELGLIVVNLEWLITGLYTVLPPEDQARQANSPLHQFYTTILDKGGHFYKADLFKAWDALALTVTEKKRLFQILEKQQLDVVYPLQSDAGDYLVPAYLKEHPAIDQTFADIDPSSCLIQGFQFTSVVPPGLFARLIVRLHASIFLEEGGRPAHWQNLLFLKHSHGDIEKPGGMVVSSGDTLWQIISKEEHSQQQLLSKQWDLLPRPQQRILFSLQRRI